MLTYPSIQRSQGQDFREFEAYLFDKLDGNNLRFEWTRRRGWHKYGTRERLFDQTDPLFGAAIPLFHRLLAEPLEKIARVQRWQKVIVFAEYWGKQSLGGLHVPGDELTLSIFDIAPDDREILDPRDFLKTCDLRYIDPAYVARFLGRQRWTRGFVASVLDGSFAGPTFEGVVGKSTDGYRAKAKTQAWIDAIYRRHGDAVGKQLVES